MIRPLIFLSYFALLLAVASAEIGAPLADKFSRAALGAQGLGWSATQLRDGRLAFGFDAVSLFDGVNWKTEPMPHTYAVRALDAASDGGCWAGGFNEVGWFTTAGGSFHYRSLTARLPPEVKSNLGDVWNVFADGPGRAVFVSTEYILQWTGQRFVVHHLPGAPRLAGFRSGGRILIGHRPTGLRALGRDGLETVLTADQLHGEGVVWAGRVGGIEVFATTAGLRILDHGALRPFAPSLDRWIQDNVLTCATELADGRLAVGTLEGGAMLVDTDGASARRLALGADLSTDSIHALFEDREKCLWVVCPAGLYRVWPTRALAVVPLPRAAAYPVRAIAPLGAGALVAGDTGLWRIDDRPGPEGKTLYQLDGFRERILQLVADGDSVLIAHRGGVSRLRPDGTVELVRAAASDVFAVAREPGGRMYLALNRGVLEVSNTNAVDLPGRYPDTPGSVVALPSGTIVVGTYASGIASVGAPSAAVHTLVRALADEPGLAFVAMSNGTLFAARGRRIVALPAGAVQGITAALAPGIELDALAGGLAGDVWVAGERQFPDKNHLRVIYHVRLDHGAMVATPLRIDSLHQAGALYSLAVQASDRGPVLWIGGESALLRVIPSELPPWSPPQPAELRVVTPHLEESGELLLPYKGNRLEVNILSPEPDRRAAIRVQTLIEGADATWINPPDQTRIALANLQDGSYRVRARFVAADESTSPITTIDFSVARPWWFTPWAIVLELVLAVVLVSAIVWLRLRSLRKHARGLEKLVAARTGQLARASAAKSAFVASMSHELRNPLNGIVASAHALDAGGLDEGQRRLLATLRHCAGLLDALIGDVLDMAEIESGTIKLRHRAYAPTDIVAAAASIVRPIAERKGLRISDQVRGDVPASAYGDAFRVQQVLLNLLGNAVKYSERGEIKLTLRRSATAVDQLEYVVQDDGPGISESEQDRLFAKFSRLPSAREKGVPGTGLGLALCRELVERMGGTIGMRSTVESGSTFWFSIPIAVGPAIETEETESASFVAPGSALVIEDIDYNADALVAILQPMGCRSEVAQTGAEALACLHKTRYDVLFIDCDLPDMTGPDLARAIVAARLSFRPRLIATTGYADDATRVRCRQSGMTGYIVKPITPQKLRAALASAKMNPAPSPPPAEVPGRGRTETLDLRQLELLGSDPAESEARGHRLGEMLQTDILLLRQACDAGDFASARATAHRIVSHARFVGAKTLALLAGEIERGARDEPELIADLLGSAETQAQQVISTLLVRKS